MIFQSSSPFSCPIPKSRLCYSIFYKFVRKLLSETRKDCQMQNSSYLPLISEGIGQLLLQSISYAKLIPKFLTKIQKSYKNSSKKLNKLVKNDWKCYKSTWKAFKTYPFKEERSFEQEKKLYNEINQKFNGLHWKSFVSHSGSHQKSKISLPSLLVKN